MRLVFSDTMTALRVAGEPESSDGIAAIIKLIKKEAS